MIITVLPQKYKCGCERGQGEFVSSGILTKLNSIIDWDNSKFPTKKKEKKEDPDVEDREFLGKDPSLKPGNCFGVDGQVIAVDSEDRLILIISETGAFSIDRLYEDRIAPELELFLWFHLDNLEYNIVSNDKIPEDYEIFNIPYKYMTLFREWSNDMETYEIKFWSDTLFSDITLYFKGWKLYYDKDSVFDEDALEIAYKSALSWCYKNKKKGS